jgi:glutathione synthase/RimK-type ligase-like ATP-grasp enzyme
VAAQGIISRWRKMLKRVEYSQFIFRESNKRTKHGHRADCFATFPLLISIKKKKKKKRKKERKKKKKEKKRKRERETETETETRDLVFSASKMY